MIRRKVIVNGVDIEERYGLVLNVKDSEFNPPELRRVELEIPGLDGSLDLTESLTGDANFKNREDTMIFNVLYSKDFSTVKTQAMNFLHGRSYDYSLSWEPGYTYHGRFAADEHYSFLHVGEIKFVVTADPWKRADSIHLEVKAANGVNVTLLNRRRRVSPTITVLRDTVIGHKNKSWSLEPGSHYLNELVLDPGENVIFVDSKPFDGTNTWNDVKAKLNDPTWEQIKDMTWSELAKYGQIFKDDATTLVTIDYDTYDL